MFAAKKGPVATLAMSTPEAKKMMGDIASEMPSAEAKKEYKPEEIKAVLAKAGSIDEAVQLIMGFLNGNEAVENETETAPPVA